MRRPLLVVGIGTTLAVGGVFVAAAVAPGLLRTGHTMRVEDFGAYWTGTKVNLSGHDAYTPANLLPLQQEIEPERTEPLAAWSPPWTFAAFAPLAPLEFPTARWAWRFIQVGAILAAVRVLWRAYRGDPEKLLWAWFAALVWYPTLQTLGLGQHSNLVLVGVTGWVAGLAAGRPFAAGACLALTLVKPQNVYLVGLLAVAWVSDRRAWRSAVGGVVGTAVLSAVVAIPNPAVFWQYLTALTSRPPTTTLPPTPGMLLRLAFGERHFWLSFVPQVAGIAWALWYYARHRRDWDWLRRGPLVVLVSCITSPYGWMYDQVLLLIPAVAVFAPLSRRPGGTALGVVAVAALTALCLALHAAGFREVTFAWHAPLCLVLYLALTRHREPPVTPSRTGR